MAFTGTWTFTPVTDLVGGEHIQWKDREYTVEVANAPELIGGELVVPLYLTTPESGRVWTKNVPANYVLAARSVR